ncbi:MAG TPA: tetratricopeptide repeat protein [Nocardioidaceae bacterium]|nr:tetratricopeptide repeat protein [Nocardioidaceae bacterium]
MRTKATIALLVVILVFYAVLIGAKGVAFVASGEPVAVVLGIGVLVLPVLGLALVWREITFGRRSAELAAALEAEGGLPLDDLPRRPSGRVERTAADEAFGARQAEVEAQPQSWQAWYRLALAYDDAGDRTRARSAVRRAIELYDGRGS